MPTCCKRLQSGGWDTSASSDLLRAASSAAVVAAPWGQPIPAGKKSGVMSSAASTSHRGRRFHFQLGGQRPSSQTTKTCRPPVQTPQKPRCLKREMPGPSPPRRGLALEDGRSRRPVLADLGVGVQPMSLPRYTQYVQSSSQNKQRQSNPGNTKGHKASILGAETRWSVGSLPWPVQRWCRLHLPDEGHILPTSNSEPGLTFCARAGFDGGSQPSRNLELGIQQNGTPPFFSPAIWTKPTARGVTQTDVPPPFYSDAGPRGEKSGRTGSTVVTRAAVASDRPDAEGPTLLIV